jgi:hypothetical protein
MLLAITDNLVNEGKLLLIKLVIKALLARVKLKSSEEFNEY